MLVLWRVNWQAVDKDVGYDDPGASQIQLLGQQLLEIVQGEYLPDEIRLRAARGGGQPRSRPRPRPRTQPGAVVTSYWRANMAVIISGAYGLLVRQHARTAAVVKEGRDRMEAQARYLLTARKGEATPQDLSL